MYVRMMLEINKEQTFLTASEALREAPAPVNRTKGPI